MVLRGVKATSNSKTRIFVIGIDRDSLAMNAKVQAGDEIVAVDNQLVGDSPLEDLEHVISYIRTYHKSSNMMILFRLRRIDFPQREIAKMSSNSADAVTRKINNNSTKKKVGRWLRKRLSSGSSEKKKKDPTLVATTATTNNWKSSLGDMWAKATAVASSASKSLRNMKSSDDDPSSYVLCSSCFDINCHNRVTLENH